MALACASVDDVLAEAALVGDNATVCELSSDASTVGVLAQWADPVRVGTELLGSRDVYMALMTALTRIENAYAFEGPAPMLSARLLARRLSLISTNSHRIQRVDLPADQVRRQALLARLGVLPSMIFVSSNGESLQLHAKQAEKAKNHGSAIPRRQK